MDRKKELKMQYKQMKPEMGVFIIRSKVNDKCFIEAAQDFKGKINGTKVRLGSGMHPNKELQKEWTEYGEANFTTGAFPLTPSCILL
ncbi:MAG: GIY-YIG nuclease family protein [Caulobacteraceae bacterium]